MAKSLILSVAGVLLAAAFLAPPARAQVRFGAQANLTLTLPSGTVKAMEEGMIGGLLGGARGDGIGWLDVRRGGLSLTAQGRGEFTMTVVALVVERGRITRVWTSPKRQLVAGTHRLAGDDFLPGDDFPPGDHILEGVQAGTAVSMDVAREAAVAGGRASVFLGRVSTATNGLLLLAMQDGADPASTTTALFFRTGVQKD